MSSTFKDEVIAALAKPLASEHVKEREEQGRKFSYIEGYKVIEEANRIFGFGNWDMKLIEKQQVAELPRKIGQRQRDGWSVTYVATVKVTVYGGDGFVERTDVGAGHGIAADLGQAHESAIKEAVTDAMKRAFRTFGNPFGLALYDKAQSNVVHGPASKEPVADAEALKEHGRTVKEEEKRIEEEEKRIKEEERFAAEEFTNNFLSLLEQAGISQFGIQTLCSIIGCSELSDVAALPPRRREKLVAAITRENVAYYNMGQNSRGTQILQPQT